LKKHDPENELVFQPTLLGMNIGGSCQKGVSKRVLVQQTNASWAKNGANVPCE